MREYKKIFEEDLQYLWEMVNLYPEDTGVSFGYIQIRIIQMVPYCIEAI